MTETSAPSPMPLQTPAYGPPIGLALAKRLAAAAEEAALARGWPMVIAIVDSTGHLVVLHKLDHAQLASVEIARLKAETAVRFKRPTKAIEDAVAGGGMGLRLLSVQSACALEGGVPLLVDGKVIGAIGISGMQSSQDGEIAAIALRVLAG